MRSLSAALGVFLRLGQACSGCGSVAAAERSFGAWQLSEREQCLASLKPVGREQQVALLVVHLDPVLASRIHPFIYAGPERSLPVEDSEMQLHIFLMQDMISDSLDHSAVAATGEDHGLACFVLAPGTYGSRACKACGNEAEGKNIPASCSGLVIFVHHAEGSNLPTLHILQLVEDRRLEDLMLSLARHGVQHHVMLAALSWQMQGIVVFGTQPFLPVSHLEGQVVCLLRSL